MTGIGGIGMSALAIILHRRGYTVTGSDKRESQHTQRLRNMGIEVVKENAEQVIKKADYLVYSSAIEPTHPERACAQANNISQIKRARLLNDLMKHHCSIAVAGTHGKTTTSTMLTEIAQMGDTDPSAAVGGIMTRFATNGIHGAGELFIAEADEYDRSFMQIHPTYAVVTNIETEHVECYTDLTQLQEAFLYFVNQVPFYGSIILNADDANCTAILPGIQHRVSRFTLQGNDAEYQARDICFKEQSTCFAVYHHNKKMGEITLNALGRHNAANAMAAITAACEAGVKFSAIQRALREYGGVKRRFEVCAVTADVTVVNDYAHHPTEVRATLDIVAQRGCRRTVVVFQPHLASRTNAFTREFADALEKADMVCVTRVYQARREAEHAEDGAPRIVQLLKDKGHTNTIYLPDTDAIVPYLTTHVTNGDCVVFMGAGDIEHICTTYARMVSND